MKCKKATELISAFIDKELLPDEEKLLTQHLAICEDCEKTLKEYLELKKFFSYNKSFKASPGLIAKIKTSIIYRPHFVKKIWKFATVFTGIAIIALGLIKFLVITEHKESYLPLPFNTFLQGEEIIKEVKGAQWEDVAGFYFTP